MNFFKKEQQEQHENAETCYICKEKFENKYLKDKKDCKFGHHCQFTGEHRGLVHSKYNLKYKAPKKNPIVFHDGLNYDYHFIKKKKLQKLINIEKKLQKKLIHITIF